MLSEHYSLLIHITQTKMTSVRITKRSEKILQSTASNGTSTASLAQCLWMKGPLKVQLWFPLPTIRKAHCPTWPCFSLTKPALQLKPGCTAASLSPNWLFWTRNLNSLRCACNYCPGWPHQASMPQMISSTLLCFLRETSGGLEVRPEDISQNVGVFSVWLDENNMLFLK